MYQEMPFNKKKERANRRLGLSSIASAGRLVDFENRYILEFSDKTLTSAGRNDRVERCPWTGVKGSKGQEVILKVIQSGT